MASDTVRVGFVGAGRNTRVRHIPGFKEIDGVELISVANRTRESSQRIADEFQISKVYDSWTDLIAAPDTNAICVGTWPYMHRTLALATLESGKHLMTEARMAMNAAEAHAMLDASRERPGLVTQIVPSPGTLKVDREIQERIATGFLGDILSIDLTVHEGGFVEREEPFHWRNDRDLSGLNVMQVGIWYEAMMRWIGPAASVTSITRVNVKSRNDDVGRSRVIAIPDQVEILCEMASGPLVHMRFSTVTGHAPADRVWFFGTEGTLMLDAPALRLYGGTRADSELSEIEIPASRQGGWRVEAEFVNAIRGLERITHTSFEDGVRYMEFTEAVTRSAQSGKKVYLPLQ